MNIYDLTNCPYSQRNAHLVKEHVADIKALFDSLPSEYSGVEVLSEERKVLYLSSFLERFEMILLPKAS